MQSKIKKFINKKISMTKGLIINTINFLKKTCNNIITLLNYHRRKVILGLGIINLVVIIILLYKLVFIASKVPDNFIYSPIRTTNALIYYLGYIPEFLLHCILNPYTAQVVAFFFQYEVLAILLLNLLVIYFYYKWYIFVFKSRFFRRIFWGLATFIYLIVYVDLGAYIIHVYPNVMTITNNQYPLYAFYFFVFLYTIIYRWLIYLPETAEEKKRREEKEKNFRKR